MGIINLIQQKKAQFSNYRDQRMVQKTQQAEVGMYKAQIRNAQLKQQAESINIQNENKALEEQNRMNNQSGFMKALQGVGQKAQQQNNLKRNEKLGYSSSKGETKRPSFFADNNLNMSYRGNMELSNPVKKKVVAGKVRQTNNYDPFEYKGLN